MSGNVLWPNDPGQLTVNSNVVTCQGSFLANDTVSLSAQLLWDPDAPSSDEECEPPKSVQWQALLWAPAENGYAELVARSDFQYDYFDGTHELTCVPSSLNGYSRPQGGSREPNVGLTLTLRFRWMYSDGTFGGQEFIEHQVGEMVPADSLLPQLRQDLIDTLRQEYLDFGATMIPSRDAVLPSLGSTLNTGNYTVQLDVRLQEHLDGVLASFRGRVVQNPSGQSYLIDDQPVTIPASAMVVISSAYRNPRRNVAAGSVLPCTSPHVWGRALDIVPDEQIQGIASNGTTVPLDLHQHLYPTLLAATQSQGTAFPEHGSQMVPIGDPSEDHVHLQWSPA